MRCSIETRIHTNMYVVYTYVHTLGYTESSKKPHRQYCLSSLFTNLIVFCFCSAVHYTISFYFILTPGLLFLRLY